MSCWAAAPLADKALARAARQEGRSKPALRGLRVGLGGVSSVRSWGRYFIPGVRNLFAQFFFLKFFFSSNGFILK